MVATGWADEPVPEEQLFDLLRDPNEAHNLAYDAPHAAVRADMAARLGRWMRDTDDPLLVGPVPAPPGAELNLPEQRSADEPTVFV